MQFSALKFSIKSAVWQLQIRIHNHINNRSTAIKNSQEISTLHCIHARIKISPLPQRKEKRKKKKIYHARYTVQFSAIFRQAAALFTERLSRCTKSTRYQRPRHTRFTVSRLNERPTGDYFVSFNGGRIKNLHITAVVEIRHEVGRERSPHTVAICEAYEPPPRESNGQALQRGYVGASQATAETFSSRASFHEGELNLPVVGRACS